eukprot:UN18808
MSPLTCATLFNKLSIIKLLLENKECNPNLQTLQGTTPLMLAVHKGNYEAVKLFLQNPSINVDIVDSENQTAADIALLGTSENRMEILQLFSEYELKKKQTESNRNTKRTNDDPATRKKLKL